MALTVMVFVSIAVPSFASDGEPADRDGLFTAIDGFGKGYRLGYPGLTSTGDVFPIHVQNTTSMNIYPSFCAHAGSNYFAGNGPPGGCTGYLVVDPVRLLENEGLQYSRLMKAFNYIMDMEELHALIDGFDDLDDCRPITQIITWWLLGNITIPSADFDGIAWDIVAKGTPAVRGIPGAKAIIEKIVANCDDYDGDGRISEVWYMLCDVRADPDHPDNHKHTLATCQPQLVPHYKPPKGRITVNKTWVVNGALLDAADAAEFEAEFAIYKGDYEDGDTPADVISIIGNNSGTSKELDPGPYTIVETIVTDGGYTWKTNITSGEKVDVAKSGTKTVNVINSRNDLGLGLFKSFTIGGDAGAIPAGVKFVFELYAVYEDGEEEVVATGEYETDGNEVPGDNYYVDLIIDEDYDFDPDMTYVLREKGPSPTPEGWVFDGNEFYVGYWEETINGVFYRSLYHHEESEPIEDEQGFGPVFINGYSFRREETKLGLFKSFRLGGAAASIPANVRFDFELYYTEEGEDVVVATGSYTTTSGTVPNANYYVPLTIDPQHSFNPQLEYKLREKGPSPTPANWEFHSGEYLVGYWEGLSNGVYYTELFYQEGTPTIENESGYGPVFINRYSYSPPPPPPELGRLIITKAFNITAVPAGWSATVTVTGPSGYNVTRTLTGTVRTITLDNLQPGVYTITESAAAGISGHVFIETLGEGAYSVTRGNTTTATITNNYEEEEEDSSIDIPPPPPPLDEYPPPPDDPPDEDIKDKDPPRSEMPKTGESNAIMFWVCGLYVSLAALCVTGTLTNRSRKRNANR